MPEYHQAVWTEGGGKLEPLIFEKGKEGRKGYSLDLEPPEDSGIPEDMRRDGLELPELSEPEVVRHYTKLSQMNYGIDSGICPLGSSTMKYNPKTFEKYTCLDEAQYLHPHQSRETVQGALEIMYMLENFLVKISGMDRIFFQPSAGAHGEFLGLLVTRAYHRSNDEGEEREEVIVPDSAHGTNPASAAMTGYKVVEVPSNERGRVDLDALRSVVSENTAAMMLTNPNTLGLFEDRIDEIVDIVHDSGALLFYDGANLNGIIGKVRPGDMGFDIVQFNLHKTFAAPHSGGGPGAGPIGVKEDLVEFLPSPLVEYDEESGEYYLGSGGENSLDRVQAFYGNFPVLVKAYSYLLSMGFSGLRQVSDTAVLNANYLREKLLGVEGYEITHGEDTPCKHEAVFSSRPMKEDCGVTARDVAKRLLDYGVQAPTHYFPPIVPEALMMETPESESREEIDKLFKAMKKTAEEADKCPEKLKSAPHRAALGRIDEEKASSEPILSWKMFLEKGGKQNDEK